ncbi:MAG: hypothetical protein A2Z14_01150, partial [Chloroflexi bacterium RBG_16_48_8]
MASLYTIDASVYLNAFNPNEEGHEGSKRLLSQFQEEGTPLVVPTLCLVEIAAVIRRGREDARLAREFTYALKRLPNFILIPLDETLTNHAIDIAATHALRGSDAVYVATAWRFGAPLITLDSEQWERGKGVIET